MSEQWSISLTEKYTGAQSLHCTVPSSGDCHAYKAKNYGYDISGRKFTMKMRVKTVNVATLQVRTYWKNSGGSWIWQNNETVTVDGTTGRWVTLTVVGTAPSGAYQAIVIIAATENGVGEFWIDDAEIISGEEKDASYTTKKTDTGTGLLYFGARFYDPEIGRFITEDFAKDGPNWYIYCRNNPLKYIDPNGLWAVMIFIQFNCAGANQAAAYQGAFAFDG
ncbi:MAG: RHS repeat-associated core domain-containing protein [Bacillota bacterium]